MVYGGKSLRLHHPGFPKEETVLTFVSEGITKKECQYVRLFAPPLHSHNIAARTNLL